MPASDLAQLFDLIPRDGPAAGVGAVPIFAFEIWFAVTLVVGSPRRTDGPLAAGAAVAFRSR